MGECGFRPPEKGRVGEGTKGKRKETEERDGGAEQTPVTGRTDPSVPSGRPVGVLISSKKKAFCGGVWASDCNRGWPCSPHPTPTSPRFEEKNQRLLELNQRCQFASSATMQWLDIRLQLMGAAVVSAIAGIALVQHQQGLANPGTTQEPSLTSEACDPHPLPHFPHLPSPCTAPQHFHLPLRSL